VRTLFSTFPRGWPGLGLLLLRMVVGATTVAEGARAIGIGNPSIATGGTAALAIGAGLAVTAGFLTPFAAASLGVGTIGVALGWIPWNDPVGIPAHVSTIFVVSMCVAIALLGPGALSVDARRRGRREIVIPQ
jgi:uncharacterized membrane protein YphA (DoxX/SURF4 family)